MSYNPQNPNGQATSANSSPVVLASDQSAIPVTQATPAAGSALDGTDATGVTQLSGGVGIRGWLSGIFSKLATLVTNGIGRTWTLNSGTDTVNVGNLPATQPVSATSLPLPSGAATDSTLATGFNALHNDLVAPLPAGSNAIGSVQANAGTNLNTSALALESGGNLAAIKADVDKIPAQGQALAANSMPVVLPAAQITTLTPPAAITGYALEAGHLATIDAKTPALGANTKANSTPVTLATDQGAIAVSTSDNVQLLSTGLVAAGPTSGIDTTGYGSVVFQISNAWNGSLWIEGSNDNATWQELLVLSADEFSMQDLITSNGVYILKTSTKYIRVNLLQYRSGTVTILAMGRAQVGMSAADLLSFAMDKTNNMPLYVQETSTKKDVTNALIPSDAPLPIYGQGNVNGQALSIIDTQGYQSVVFQLFGTFTATIQTFGSNDGINWNSINSFPTSGGGGDSTTVSSPSIYVIPAISRYVKLQISAYTSGLVQVNSYLRQQTYTPFTPIGVNRIGGGSVVTAGVNGTLAVGGNIAVGVAPTLNPLSIGGVDGSNLMRRILTDVNGRLQVQDVTVTEGQSNSELLTLILLELRILTQQMKELPLRLNAGQQDPDEPSVYRNDPNFFTL